MYVCVSCLKYFIITLLITLICIKLFVPAAILFGLISLRFLYRAFDKSHTQVLPFGKDK